MAEKSFSFGSVASSQYINFDEPTPVTLPYDPFFFPLHLRLTHSLPPYENIGLEWPLQEDLSFGRGKQQSVQLKAETISRKHFSILKGRLLRDEMSRIGTYVWIPEDQPTALRHGEQFRVGGVPMQVKWNGQEWAIILNNKDYALRESLTTIGSDKQCTICLPNMIELEATIDLRKGCVMNMVPGSLGSSSHGLWRRLNKDEEWPLDVGQMFMADPYIFTVTA